MLQDQSQNTFQPASEDNEEVNNQSLNEDIVEVEDSILWDPTNFQQVLYNVFNQALKSVSWSPTTFQQILRNLFNKTLKAANKPKGETVQQVVHNVFNKTLKAANKSKGETVQQVVENVFNQALKAANKPKWQSVGNLANDPKNGNLLGTMAFYFNELIKELDQVLRTMFLIRD